MELFFKTLHRGELVDCEICTYDSMVCIYREGGFVKHIGHYRPEHICKDHTKILTIFRYTGKKIKPMDEKVYEGHIIKNVITESVYYVFWDVSKAALKVKNIKSQEYYDLDVLDEAPFEIIGHITQEGGHETVH